MRARDVRAITFCIATTALVLALSWWLTRRWPVVAALTAAYGAWILTRPRMLRVYRRMRGHTVERISYYRD